MPPERRAQINVFCSYSDEDQRFQESLEKHLTSLVREGSVLVWARHKVRAGQKRRREIDAQLEKARLILLLISSNFISSDDCYAGGLVRALQRYHNDNVCVISILVKPCTWDELAFSSFQVLPRNRVPVSLWRSRDEAFTHIVDEIKIVVKDLLLYGRGYMEPLQPKQGKSFSSLSSRPPSTNQRTHTTPKTRGVQKQAGTRSRQQTRVLRENAARPANRRYVKPMPRRRSTSVGNTRGGFLTFFFGSLSGHAFEQRCKRWKGKSAALLFLFALLDLYLLPNAVYLRSHSFITAVAIGFLSLFLFASGVSNDKNAIGVSLTLLYDLVWIGMAPWYLNSYLTLGLSPPFLFLLISLATLLRLLIFLWRTPFGQR